MSINNNLFTKFSTIAEVLQWRAAHQPAKVGYTFLNDGEVENYSLTYQDLDFQAKLIAGLLLKYAQPGDRALLIYPPGLDFIISFFGCLYAGIIAVPVDMPRRNQRTQRLQKIVSDAQSNIILTMQEILPKLEESFPDSSGMQLLGTDSLEENYLEPFELPNISRDDLAFLQYTSGSTGSPKGVMVSHGNLLHNEEMIKQAFKHSDSTIFVGWLPLFHDMGLIGNVLQPLYLGIPSYLMSPVAFLQKPIRWLKVIEKYKATTSGGPDFAYDFCVRKITPEQRVGLDLSSWNLAFNGAEPIRAETLDKFSQTFGEYGFNAATWYPCYGMAETTLFITGKGLNALPIVKQIDSVDLSKNKIVISDKQTDYQYLTKIVSSGRAWLDTEIAIVNPELLTRCAPDQVGEIWVSSESVAQGYWNREEETEKNFQAHLKDDGSRSFLRTGDLGYLQDGELFVTGRIKDLIIIRGRNHYPQDIERTVEQSHESLQKNCAAAFSISVTGEETLVILVEVQRSYLRHIDVEKAISAIRQSVAENHELQVHGIVLLKTGSIPKTSSGKIQRHACQSSFLNNSLDSVGSNILEDFSNEENTGSLSREALLAIDPSERCKYLISSLKQQISQLLKVSSTQLYSHQPLTAFGLDSLVAIELQNNIEEQLSIDLPMSRLLSGASIDQLADELLSSLGSEKEDWNTLIKRNDSKEKLPKYALSYGQKSLWFMHKLAPESAAYNICQAVHICSKVDAMALQQAFQGLVERHATLRTNFKEEGGEPIQKIVDGVEIDFQIEDASTWSDSSLKEWLIIEGHRPFNLEQDRLLRVRLLKRSTQDFVLLLVIHHIISDFWSLAVILQELGKLYETEKTGAVVPLQALNLEYTDYANWQSKMLASSESSKLWTYWQKQLAGELPVLQLPTDRPRPSIQTYRGAAISFNLSTKLTSKLKALSREQGATLYMTLLAAFQVLLYRHTGQEDILVGSPTAGRSKSDLSALVGYFVNPVVMRADISQNYSFVEFLKQVCQTVLDAFAHQDYPLALLVEKLQPVRDPSRSPLFQTMFAWQKAHLLDEAGLTSLALGQTGARMRLGDLEVESFPLEQRISQLDLTLMMAEVEGELSGVWEYNTDLFNVDTIHRLSSHFQTLLEGIVDNPQQRISVLPLLTAADRHQLLVEWNDTKTDYPQDKCIHQLFEEQVERTPDAIAVVFEDLQLTYRELNCRSNQLAHYLQSLGVKPDVLVGICVERSIEMVVGMLGVLKAGAAYVPLDPAYPPDRLSFMVEDAQISILLTERSMMANLELAVDLSICLDSESAVFKSAPEDNPLDLATSDDLAYIIYTSGSTGQPKGVMVSHQSIVNRLVWGIDRYQLTPSDRLFQKTSFSFDVSVWEIFGTLLAGASLVLARSGGHQDPAYLVKTMAEQRITHVDFVPAMLKYVIEAPGIENCSSLRYVTCGGESLPLNVRDRFFDRLPSVELQNCYGPTEVSIDATAWVCDRNSPLISIGRPIANQQAYILDDYLQPVPIGVVGELYIGGVGLSRGYLNRPDLTAEKFINYQLSIEKSLRLYRTGDLARFLPDGNIEFLGRLDSQVKLRGFRIELGEIERVLSCHPEVDDAVVLIKSEANDRANEFLLAYLVPSDKKDRLPKQNLELSIPDIRTYLSQNFPEYMIPTMYSRIPYLPRNPSGKLDYYALSLFKTDYVEFREHYVTPHTALEQVLTGIWTEVLQLEKIGIRDDFFNLGGHSLLAIQVNSRLREIFSLELPLHSLFEATTIEKLAQLLINKENKPGQVEKIAQIIQKINSMSEREIEEKLQQKKVGRA
jgi:amino acid adenylation domain-containing protein